MSLSSGEPTPQPDESQAGDILTSEAFRDLLARSPLVELKCDALLIEQGARSDAAYFLAKGEVSVFTETTYGQVPLATLKAPRLIGEVGALADLPRTAGIKALTDAEVYRIDRAQILELGHRHPDLLVSVISQLGRQLENVNTTIGLYTNALSALERREFDPHVLEDLQNPPPQLSEFATVFRRFAAQIAVKRRHEDEMASAAMIQTALLPRDDLPTALQATGQAEMAAAIRPAREVGGDFYDYFLIDEHRLAFAIGDVCGKGLPASLFMTMVLTVLRTAAKEQSTVASTIARANAILCQNNDHSLFATTFFGVLDLRSGHLEYCNCGHNPPMVLSPEGTLQWLPATGLPLAIFDDRSASAVGLSLAAGACLVLYTDGVTEALNERDEEFGRERLVDTLLSLNGARAAEMVTGLLTTTAAFAGAAVQADDITVMVIKPATRANVGSLS
jgi:serine phosphatase RsbU (regulator of sigma subunit)